MKRIANTLAAFRPHRDRWLATARRLLVGEQHGEAAPGLGSKALCSALSAPFACIVAGAALASVASSAGVNDAWTRMTAQSFIPVDARGVAANPFYVPQVEVGRASCRERV